MPHTASIEDDIELSKHSVNSFIDFLTGALSAPPPLFYLFQMPNLSGLKQTIFIEKRQNNLLIFEILSFVFIFSTNNKIHSLNRLNVMKQVFGRFGTLPMLKGPSGTLTDTQLDP